MMLPPLDECLTDLAAALPDDELRRQLTAAERAANMVARTRREIALHRVYCLQCELRRRSLYAQRVAIQRSPRPAS